MRVSRHRACIAAAAVVLAVATRPATATAIEAVGPREVVDVTFTTTQPGSPTGVTYRSQIRHPINPNAPPIALRRLIVGAPAGSVIDTSVPGRCTASDEELRLQGNGICPPGSLVGSGWAEIDVDLLGRQRFEANAFNNDGQQVETVGRGRQVQAVVRGFFREEGLDARIPTCITGGQAPRSCPSDQARLVASELVVPELTVAGRSYFVTPPSCPANGRWVTPIILNYADGVTERVYPEQPCTPPPAPPACTSRRRIVLRALARRGLRSITATFQGKRRRLDPERPVIDLRGLPRGTYAIRIAAVTRSGERLRRLRRYRTCRPA